MRELDQLIVIIPVVLNLKGNIEMNLSARLGTAANMGELDNPTARRTIIVGNLTLLQVQATAVSFAAACVSLLLGFALPRHATALPTVPGSDHMIRGLPSPFKTLVPRRSTPRPSGDSNRKTDIHTFMMVAASAMSAASLSGLLLGSFMCTLVVLCRVFGRDPDNIAPPIASCLGDLVTLCLLGLISNFLIPFLNTPIPFVIFILVLVSAITCLCLTRRNQHVRGLLLKGWSPLFGAMIISSGTGIVLDLFVSKYAGFAVLAVVISGLPGATGSIFVSRLSTSLHAAALKHLPTSESALNLPHTSVLISRPASRQFSLEQSLGQIRPNALPIEISPRLTMLTLLLITLPVELIFLSLLNALGWLHPPFIFVALSLFFFCCAVLASLCIARLLTDLLWKRGLDPDMYALPIHSALMDLIGQLLLVLCFELVSLLIGSAAVVNAMKDR
ncbi:hypothetical protein AX17_001911 [Amanita inopinata Kibby_2008]|nr:hypothetical protein AX17_001911 [Amanita inopinata Kibby_2008]